jgi:replicative DNA helicase
VSVARGVRRNAAAGGAGGDGALGRVPPHDIDAEKAVLSSVLLDNEALHGVMLQLAPDDFYVPAHQSLFKAMLALKDESQPVDVLTLSDYITTHKQMDAIGGPGTLGEIADFEATAANVSHHAEIVRDKSLKRRLIGVASEIVEMGFEQDDTADRLLDSAEAKMLGVSQTSRRSDFASLHDQMPETFDYIENIMNRGGELTGTPTGFQELDKMTGGLQPGELVVVAARPSMGKTALALNIARNAAIDHSKKVAVFSLEMTTRALVLRLLSAEARVDFSNLRKGYLPMEEFKRLTAAGDRLSQAALWIDDAADATILEIKAKSRRLYSDQGLDLVILDYLQLAKGDPSSGRERKDLEIAEISKGLKALAKELHIPVIALSQLNRGPEQRDPDKRRPMLGDLRESGAIEQDADVIAFIYRDEVYNRDNLENRGIAELNIEKQRNGPTGRVKLHFEARYARFDDLAESEGAPGAPQSGGFAPPDDGFGDETPF